MNKKSLFWVFLCFMRYVSRFVFMFYAFNALFVACMLYALCFDAPWAGSR